MSLYGNIVVVFTTTCGWVVVSLLAWCVVYIVLTKGCSQQLWCRVASPGIGLPLGRVQDSCLWAGCRTASGPGAGQLPLGRVQDSCLWAGCRTAASGPGAGPQMQDCSDPLPQLMHRGNTISPDRENLHVQCIGQTNLGTNSHNQVNTYTCAS